MIQFTCRKSAGNSMAGQGHVRLETGRPTNHYCKVLARANEGH